jgi:hypothetical protein
MVTNLLVIITGAAFATVLPTPAQATARLAAAAADRAPRQGAAAMQLAAKKKKKKKGGAKRPSSGGADPADDDDDKGGDDAAASAGGASDDEVQRAARVAPAGDSGGSGGGDARASRTSKRSAIASEEGVSASRSSDPSAPSEQRFLDVAIGGNAFARSLTYNQAVGAGNLREYQPRLLGGAAAAIVYYPGAQFSNGFVTNVGLAINVNQAFGITSRTPDMVSYSTSIHDYNGGVRLRLPLDNLEPSVTLGFGDQAYTFSGAGRDALLLPDVHYQYVRAVAGLLVQLPSKLSLFAGGGYRHVLSAGQIKDTYFKNLHVAGVEATAYVAYAITSMIEARAGFDLRRYFYAFHAKSGDMYIVGGAVDQTISGSLSLAVLLGGSDRPRSGGGSSVSEEPATTAAAPSEEGDSELRAKPKKRKHLDME